MSLETGELIYNGKAKDIYKTNNDDEVLIKFRDDITAGDGEKKDNLNLKGYYNSIISAKIFEILEEGGINTQYINLLEPRYMLSKKLKMMPIEVIARNIAAGSLIKRFPFNENQTFSPAIIQLDYKNDEYHDPMLNEDIAKALNLANEEELNFIKETTLKLNDILKSFFEKKGLLLVDFKVEFGKDVNGKIVLGDEISPDSCRLWDMETKESMDKDIYREDKGDVLAAYKEIASLILTENDKKRFKVEL